MSANKRTWVITADVISAEFNEPVDVPASIYDPEAKGGDAFRIYDDDGNLYYRGRHFGDSGSESGFEPLDWATGFAGATTIKYRNAETGVWEVL